MQSDIVTQFSCVARKAITTVLIRRDSSMVMGAVSGMIRMRLLGISARSAVGIPPYSERRHQVLIPYCGVFGHPMFDYRPRTLPSAHAKQFNAKFGRRSTQDSYTTSPARAHLPLAVAAEDGGDQASTTALRPWRFDGPRRSFQAFFSSGPSPPHTARMSAAWFGSRVLAGEPLCNMLPREMPDHHCRMNGKIIHSPCEGSSSIIERVTLVSRSWDRPNRAVVGIRR